MQCLNSTSSTAQIPSSLPKASPAENDTECVELGREGSEEINVEEKEEFSKMIQEMGDRLCAKTFFKL